MESTKLASETIISEFVGELALLEGEGLMEIMNKGSKGIEKKKELETSYYGNNHLIEHQFFK